MSIIRRYGANIDYQIRYIANAKITPTVTTGWGGNIIDLGWDSVSKEGYIKFDKPINTIPSKAFFEQPNLIAITHIPRSVTTINNGAFRNDTTTESLKNNIESIILNEGLIHIKNRAFLTCRDLSKMKLPNTLEYIDSYAFNGCVNLNEIIFGENFKKFIDSANGSNDNVGSSCFGLCYKLKTVVWNTINCEDFTSSSKSPFTSDSMFGDENYVNPIETVVFGNKVKHIPSYLFWKVQKLSGDIIIPESVETIGDRAFQACQEINTIICLSKTPPLITPGGNNTNFTAGDGKNVVFRYYTNGTWKILPKLTIYVPKDSLNLYKNDPNWSVYFDVIKPFVDNYKGVDLGLRDSNGNKLLFGDKNIGASNDVYGIGWYHAWGDTTGHAIVDNSGTSSYFIDYHVFNPETYIYSNDDYTIMTAYNSSDGKTTLEPWDDAATYHLGGKWRTPTADELGLLLDTNNFQMDILDINGNIIPISDVTRNDLKLGIRFTSKIHGFEGNSIFIPACGAGNEGTAGDIHKTVSIWASTLYPSNVKKAQFLYFYITEDNNISIRVSETNRYYGRQIRPIMTIK